MTRAALTPESLKTLEEAAKRLAEQGDVALAQKLESIASALQSQAADRWLTTGETAEMLGIRSVNTIKRWVRDGLLAGVRRGGRVLVSQQSVAQFAATPVLAQEAAYERQRDQDLAVLDGDDDALPTTGLVGRRPWVTQS